MQIISAAVAVNIQHFSAGIQTGDTAAFHGHRVKPIRPHTAGGAGARFLFRLAKAARKYWTALAVVTQDADDVLASPLGRAIISNAATQILLRQAPQAIETISEQFHLSHGEREFLLSATRGEALLLAGDRRHKVALTGVAAPGEHEVITTDPGELAAQLPDESTSHSHDDEEGVL